MMNYENNWTNEKPVDGDIFLVRKPDGSLYKHILRFGMNDVIHYDNSNVITEGMLEEGNLFLKIDCTANEKEPVTPPKNYKFSKLKPREISDELFESTVKEFLTTNDGKKYIGSVSEFEEPKKIENTILIEILSQNAKILEMNQKLLEVLSQTELKVA